MKYTLFEKVLVQYKAIKTLFDFNKYQYDTMVTTENENALQQIISHNFRLGWIFSKLLEIEAKLSNIEFLVTVDETRNLLDDCICKVNFGLTKFRFTEITKFKYTQNGTVDLQYHQNPANASFFETIISRNENNLYIFLKSCKTKIKTLLDNVKTQKLE